MPLKFALSVVAVHVILTAFLGAVLNIWSDEACTIASTDHDLAMTIRRAVDFEWQPPGYFLLLYVWRQFGSSILWIRLFSVVCTSLAIVYAFLTFRRMACDRGAHWPYWATIVFAFHPYTFFAATEIRVYAMGLCLSAVLTHLFWLAFIERQVRWRWWYFFFAVVGLYVNILLIAILAAQSATLWMRSEGKWARQHLIGLVLVGIVYFPMFMFQLQSRGQKDTPLAKQSTWVTSTSFILGTVTHDVAPLPRIDETRVIRGAMMVLLVVVAVWLVCQNRPSIAGHHIDVWIHLFWVAFLLVVLLVAGKLAPFERYAYPLLLAALAGWGKLTEFIASNRRVAVLWMISTLLSAGTLLHTYLPLHKSGDWIRVVRYLELHERENEPVLAFRSEVDTIIQHYYRRKNRVVPIPNPQRLDRFLNADYDIPDEETVRILLDPILAGCSRCWLITNNLDCFPHQSNREYLDRYLDKHFQVVERKEFFESAVTLYERK